MLFFRNLCDRDGENSASMTWHGEPTIRPLIGSDHAIGRSAAGRDERERESALGVDAGAPEAGAAVTPEARTPLARRKKTDKRPRLRAVGAGREPRARASAVCGPITQACVGPITQAAAAPGHFAGERSRASGADRRRLRLHREGVCAPGREHGSREKSLGGDQ
jgi:hypothetical protein